MLALDEKTIIIGKLGEEGELVFPRQAAEGPDGNICVYDAVDVLVLFTPEFEWISFESHTEFHFLRHERRGRERSSFMS